MMDLRVSSVGGRQSGEMSGHTGAGAEMPDAASSTNADDAAGKQKAEGRL